MSNTQHNSGTDYRPEFPLVNPSGSDYRPDISSNIHQSNYSTNPSQKAFKTPLSEIVNPRPKLALALTFPAIQGSQIGDYITSVIDVVSKDGLISASRISRQRVCVYLKNEETVNNFINNHGGITIKNQFLPVSRFINPTKKLILSNLHTSIPNSILKEQLEKHNLKLASTIKDLHVRIPGRIDLNYVASFRRFVYVQVDKDMKIPDSILFNFEGHRFRFYITDDSLKCYLCKSTGHIGANCDKLNTDENADMDDEYEEENDDNVNNDNNPNNNNNAHIAENAAESAGSTKQTPILPQPIPVNISNITDQQTTMDSTGPLKRTLSSSGSVSSQQSSHTTNEISQENIIKIPQPTHAQTKPKKMKTENSSPPKDKTIIPIPNPQNMNQDSDSDNKSSKSLLISIEDNFNSCFKNGKYPISFTNFVLLMDMVKANKDPVSVVRTFTSDIQGIQSILHDNYTLLNSRSMKTRFTKLSKKLLDEPASSPGDSKS